MNTPDPTRQREKIEQLAWCRAFSSGAEAIDNNLPVANSTPFRRATVERSL